MPAICSSCRRSFSKICLLLAHVRTIHASHPGFKISCSTNGCSRNFTSFRAFRNHVYAYHGGSNDYTWEDSAAREPPQDPCDDDGDLTSKDSQINDIDDSEPSEEYVQQAAAMSIVKIREQHRLPQSVMSDIIFEIQSLYDVALSVLKHHVGSTLTAADVSPVVIQEVVRHLETSSPYSSVF